MRLLLGDCLQVMKDLMPKSVDMILCDLPYGTTACKWDITIPFEALWFEYKRIIKSNGAVCLFGTEPFSSYLRMSNLKWFKYDWIWRKNKPTGFTNAKYRPLCSTEHISVFSKAPAAHGAKSPMKFFPQGLIIKNRTIKNSVSVGGIHIQAGTKTSLKGEYFQEFTHYPTNILEYKNTETEKQHPTQKPVPLLEYLIKTYTNEDDTVMDNTMGSGSTGVACKNLNRYFIGIEKDEKYFNVAQERLK